MAVIDEIKQEETVTVPIEEIDTNANKSVQHIRNDVLNILGPKRVLSFLSFRLRFE